MKSHLRLDVDDEREYVLSLLAQATAHAEALLQVALMPRMVTAIYEAGEAIELPRGPVMEVLAVTDYGRNVEVSYAVRRRGSKTTVIDLDDGLPVLLPGGRSFTPPVTAAAPPSRPTSLGQSASTQRPCTHGVRTQAQSPRARCITLMTGIATAAEERPSNDRQSGRLNERITLLDPQSVLDEAGQADTSARPVWTVWAEVKQSTSTEDLDNGQTRAKVSLSGNDQVSGTTSANHWQLQRACGTVPRTSAALLSGDAARSWLSSAHEER